MPAALRPLALPLFASLVLSACGGGNTASQLAKTPTYDPAGQSKCSVEKSQSKPLIVEWPSTDRGELETRARGHGVVVVRYQGCEMQVLDRCAAPAKYVYAPMTRKKDRVQMRDADSLYANVPLGAAGLEAELEKSGELDVDMTLVGRWEAERASVRADELQGECDGATHVVSALTIGAFTFTAGADATVGAGANVMGAGGGAKSASTRRTLNADGDEAACEKATLDDKAPPSECGALIRVEVVRLAEAQAPSAAAPVPATSPAPAGPAPAVSTTGTGGIAGTWSCADVVDGTIITPPGRPPFHGSDQLTVVAVNNGDGTVSVTMPETPLRCTWKLHVSGATAEAPAGQSCAGKDPAGNSATMTLASFTATVDGAGWSTRSTGTISGTIQGNPMTTQVTRNMTCTKP
jgi:hypothetical protein